MVNSRAGRQRLRRHLEPRWSASQPGWPDTSHKQQTQPDFFHSLSSAVTGSGVAFNQHPSPQALIFIMSEATQGAVLVPQQEGEVERQGNETIQQQESQAKAQHGFVIQSQAQLEEIVERVMAQNTTQVSQIKEGGKRARKRSPTTASSWSDSEPDSSDSSVHIKKRQKLKRVHKHKSRGNKRIKPNIVLKDPWLSETPESSESSGEEGELSGEQDLDEEENTDRLFPTDKFSRLLNKALLTLKLSPVSGAPETQPEKPAVLKLLPTAKVHQATAETSLNKRSSRSHGIFQLRVEGHNASRWSSPHLSIPFQEALRSWGQAETHSCSSDGRGELLEAPEGRVDLHRLPGLQGPWTRSWEETPPDADCPQCSERELAPRRLRMNQKLANFVQITKELSELPRQESAGGVQQDPEEKNVESLQAAVDPTASDDNMEFLSAVEEEDILGESRKALTGGMRESVAIHPDFERQDSNHITKDAQQSGDRVQEEIRCTSSLPPLQKEGNFKEVSEGPETESTTIRPEFDQENPKIGTGGAKGFVDHVSEDIKSDFTLHVPQEEASEVREFTGDKELIEIQA
ncbi:hypothetical protein lerEdw1_005039 [Lerista edwardsae]|nr:hypothetical protein lerEdw1_005039 [Lerista edwardsae]